MQRAPTSGRQPRASLLPAGCRQYFEVHGEPPPPRLDAHRGQEPERAIASASASWSAAVLCRFRQRVAFAKRQRTAALQDADALATALFGSWMSEAEAPLQPQ